ncbi:MAG: hypothetical protein B7Z57_01760 [Acidiphilium sp. 37-60-79]|nr:MAG: hypothetical protein B7Z57_01760 [Acidiphilium sp. 37-60-79]
MTPQALRNPMPDQPDAAHLAELRRVAEDQLAPPSQRVAARQALREYRRDMIEANRQRLIEVIQSAINRP